MAFLSNFVTSQITTLIFSVSTISYSSTCSKSLYSIPLYNVYISWADKQTKNINWWSCAGHELKWPTGYYSMPKHQNRVKKKVVKYSSNIHKIITTSLTDGFDSLFSSVCLLLKVSLLHGAICYKLYSIAKRQASCPSSSPHVWWIKNFNNYRCQRIYLVVHFLCTSAATLRPLGGCVKRS